jgi:23S rRNA (uracil1939-C5)-methyltransferase
MNDKPTEETKPKAAEPENTEPVELTIEKLVTGGAGLGRIDGQAVFVPMTAPGDVVKATFVERRKGFARATLDEIVTPGPGRREAPCPHFGQCGGCDLQHLEPETQRQAKADIVTDCFQRLGKMDVSEMIEGPAAGTDLGYRNRIRVFANPANFYGLMRRGTHEVVPLDSCALMPEQFNKDILPWLRFLPPVEQIVVRMDGNGGWLVSAFGPPPRMKIMKKIISALADGEAPAPGCLGVLYNNLPLWGRNYLLHEIKGHKFRVSAKSFFQGNHEQAELAIDTIREWVSEDGERPGGLLGDLYCGVGLFSLALADLFDQVVAIDSDPGGCRDARTNIQHDPEAKDKVTVHVGRMTDLLGKTELAPAAFWNNGTCVVDPPRAGMGKEVVQALLKSSPRRLVYMSCDPATLARDAAALVEGGYEIKKLKVLDMFPQTAHIESLLLLDRKAI